VIGAMSSQPIIFTGGALAYSANADSTGSPSGARNTVGPLTINVDLTTLYPSNYRATTIFGPNITFAWTLPTFAGGTGSICRNFP